MSRQDLSASWPHHRLAPCLIRRTWLLYFRILIDGHPVGVQPYMSPYLYVIPGRARTRFNYWRLNVDAHGDARGRTRRGRSIICERWSCGVLQYRRRAARPDVLQRLGHWDGRERAR